jgi:hypothetical protein
MDGVFYPDQIGANNKNCDAREEKICHNGIILLTSLYPFLLYCIVYVRIIAQVLA